MRASTLLLLVAVGAPARASEGAVPPESPAPVAVTSGPAPTRSFRYSEYERDTIDAALASLGLVLEPDPEGRPVEAIVTVRLEVIEERDPAPRFVNVFHVVTREYVIDREVLLRPGDAYHQALADETRRRLAALPQLSLALVLPVRGEAPGAVRLLVITKDVWSIRLNGDISYTGGGIEKLSVNPTETNLLGTHQQLGAQFTYFPESYSLGATYEIPRIAGSHVRGAAESGLIFSTRGRGREGSYGSAEVELPLWSSRAEWAWSVSGSWLKQVSRLYSNARVATFALRPDVSCAAQPSPCVPFVYDTDTATATASVTRSFGWAVKRDVTLGFEGRRRRFAAPDLSAYDPATVLAFVTRRVPVSDDRVGPFLQLRTYTTAFLRILDLDTLALQEDYRLGLDASLLLYSSVRSLGGSRDVLGASAGAAYTLPLGDGLVRAGVGLLDELDTARGAVSDGSVQATLRLASPRWPAGRLVLDGLLRHRYRNYLQVSEFLGGDGRLRGYPTNYFVGTSLLALNAEYRSRAVQILRSLQVGAVLFFDAGDAFDGFGDLDLRLAAGGGLRALIPQVERIVFRVDVGFPLSRPLPSGVAPVSFFAKFGQAF